MMPRTYPPSRSKDLLPPTRCLMWSLPQPMVLQYVVGCQGICNLALWCCSVLYYGVYKIDYRGFVTATLAGSSFGLVLWLGSSIAIQKMFVVALFKKYRTSILALSKTKVELGSENRTSILIASSPSSQH
ncbi:hypothetical protein HMI54_015044 [Coelomomyces lativittatus]|nr:hypothetical protein HMI56_005494 [Coelomomyces lativittatus]KAJ1518560.1 hypothetical protein HMI54_015044 [Coelomomyces lativittatus]